MNQVLYVNFTKFEMTQMIRIVEERDDPSLGERADYPRANVHYHINLRVIIAATINARSGYMQPKISK